jgi:hypothetical protein
MQHRFFLGMNPPKCQIKKTGALNATRLNSTLRRENLSLTGCSSAEPVSVSVQQYKFQTVRLYLQLVKKVNHLPLQCILFVMCIIVVGGQKD